MHPMPPRRLFLAGAGASLVLPAVARPPRIDAAVIRDGARAPSGVPRYPSLPDALRAAPANRADWRIWLGEGVWEGQVEIVRPRTHLVGADRHRTMLRFTAASGQIAPDGKPYGTFRTPTLTIAAPDCSLANLTVTNGFDTPGEARKAKGGLQSEGALGAQALALAVTRDADRTLLTGIDLTGYQDTLFLDAGRTLVTGDTLVTGTVDFIFGAGTAFFDRCEIRSRRREAPVETFIAAPSTLADRRYGLVFDRCRLTAEEGVPDGSVFLGRPWRPTTTFADGRYGNPRAVGMAAFVGCAMGAHIAGAGWTEMTYGRKEGGRAALQPEDVRFSESGSTGPGARGARRVPPLTLAEATMFARARVLGDWRI